MPVVAAYVYRNGQRVRSVSIDEKVDRADTVAPGSPLGERTIPAGEGSTAHDSTDSRR